MLDDVVAAGGVCGGRINVGDVEWPVVVAVQLDVLDQGGVVSLLLLLLRWFPNCEVASDEQGDTDVVVVRFPPENLVSVLSCSACVFSRGCGVDGCLLDGEAIDVVVLKERACLVPCVTQVLGVERADCEWCCCGHCGGVCPVWVGAPASVVCKVSAAAFKCLVISALVYLAHFCGAVAWRRSC